MVGYQIFDGFFRPVDGGGVENPPPPVTMGGWTEGPALHSGNPVGLKELFGRGLNPGPRAARGTRLCFDWTSRECGSDHDTESVGASAIAPPTPSIWSISCEPETTIGRHISVRASIQS